MEIKLKKLKGTGNIIKYTDFTDAVDRGEIAHFIAELETMKIELLELWDNNRDSYCEFEKE